MSEDMLAAARRRALGDVDTVHQLAGNLIPQQQQRPEDWPTRVARFVVWTLTAAFCGVVWFGLVRLGIWMFS